VPTDDPSASERIDATRRSSAERHDASADDQDGWEVLRTLAPQVDHEDPLGKELMRRALFPRRTAPLRIGRFTVLHALGSGGMGVVYACFDDQLDRKVAVKVLHDGGSGTASARLLREAQAMARLSHPNIVTVHEVGQDRGRVFVAMEFVPGATLEVWAAPPRPWREVLAAFVQAGRGLAAAHRAGIIHRDFKPQNVMVGDDGAVKVLDFGLARALDDAAADAGRPGRRAPSLSLTRTGAVIGTPVYMAPEQHRGERGSVASDQFNFCASLYHALYGAPPFASSSLAALLSDVFAGRVAPPPPRSPVPSWLHRVVLRGLAIEPERRFASMTELLAALGRDPGRLRRRVAALVVTAALTGAAGFAAAASSAAEVQRCPDARAELGGVWDAERAAAVRGALAAWHLRGADELLATVEPQIDRYARAWVEQREEACLAHIEGRQSARLFELRSACLEQRRAGLDALVASLALTDATTSDHLVEATRELPPLASCADVEALTAAVPLPAEPRARRRVQDHREALARAAVHEAAGQHRLGLQIVAGVLADAATLHHEPTLAEAHLRAGTLHMAAGEHAAAERALTEALWFGVGAGHDAVAAQASAKRAYLQAVALGRPAQAQAELALTRALNERVRDDVALYADYLTNIGVVAAMSGEPGESGEPGGLTTARRRWEEAMQLREQHGLARTQDGLETLGNLGWLARMQNRHADMAEIYGRTTALAEELLGPGHTVHVRHALLLADSLHRLGRPQQALARLRGLTDRVDRVDPLLRAQLFHELGTIALEQGEPGPAREHLTLALAAAPAASEEHDALLCHLMRAAATAGDAAATEDHRARALGRLPRPLDARERRTKWYLLEHGRSLALLGRPREGLAALEQLEAALTGVAGDDAALERAELALVVARVRRDLGDHDAAARQLRAAADVLTRILPAHTLTIAEAMQALGEVELERENFSAAADALAQALEIYAAIAEPGHAPVAPTRFAYARALTGAAAVITPEARAHAEQALATLRAGDREAAANAVSTWLAAHRGD